MMGSSELHALAEDIRRNGLLHPITTYEGRILDGRNRFAACQKAGITPRFEPYKGMEPLALVISANVMHRHLTGCQRAILAADLLPRLEVEAKQRMRQGRAKLPDPKKQGRARDHAAATFGVSARYIQDAKGILAEDPEVAKAVRDGRIKIVEATALLKLNTSRERLQILAKKAANPKHINVALEAQAVSNKRMLIGAASLATVKGKYQLFYIDPPWKEDCPSVSRPVPYPQMTQAELLALAPQVQRLAADKAIIFMWTTSPRLPEALELMRAYGFEYRTSAIWCKEGKAGLGHWLRNQHEQLLVGLRGKFPTPPTHCKPNSVVHAPLRGHSKKPDEIYTLIESMYPGVNLRKLELFARHRHDSSWEVWGAEAPVVKARQTPIAA
jgi:N6-adenosine-specific RNA methylase IME4